MGFQEGAGSARPLILYYVREKFRLETDREVNRIVVTMTLYLVKQAI